MSEQNWINTANSTNLNPESLGLSHLEVCNELGICTESTAVGVLSRESVDGVTNEDCNRRLIDFLDHLDNDTPGMNRYHELYRKSNRGGWDFLCLVDIVDDISVDGLDMWKIQNEEGKWIEGEPKTFRIGRE